MNDVRHDRDVILNIVYVSFFFFCSDPFVIIELLPRRVFSHCTEQQTHVHKVNMLDLCQADGEKGKLFNSNFFCWYRLFFLFIRKYERTFFMEQ